MLATLVSTVLSIVQTVGLPALFVVFVLKGAIIGKPLPTSVVLPGYIFTTGDTRWLIGLAVVIASVGYVTGQLLIYWIARQYGFETVQSTRWVSVSDAQLDRANRVFRTYSGGGIFVTNLLPYVGSFLCIPAGMARYPVGRLTVYALVSTVLNYQLIVLAVILSVEFVISL